MFPLIFCLYVIFTLLIHRPLSIPLKNVSNVLTEPHHNTSVDPGSSNGGTTDQSHLYPGHHSDSHVAGVWPVTKIVSLFGPTIAIFIYGKARDAYERYEPFVNAAVLDFAQTIHHAVQSPYSGRAIVWLSSMPQSHANPEVTRTANEIIRLTNVHLREKAVISRIQMDDDQYELSRSMSATDVRNTALKVMRKVLQAGTGKRLTPDEKAAVHALIASSVY